MSYGVINRVTTADDSSKKQIKVINSRGCISPDHKLYTTNYKT